MYWLSVNATEGGRAMDLPRRRLRQAARSAFATPVRPGAHAVRRRMPRHRTRRRVIRLSDREALVGVLDGAGDRALAPRGALEARRERPAHRPRQPTCTWPPRVWTRALVAVGGRWWWRGATGGGRGRLRARRVRTSTRARPSLRSSRRVQADLTPFSRPHILPIGYARGRYGPRR